MNATAYATIIHARPSPHRNHALRSVRVAFPSPFLTATMGCDATQCVSAYVCIRLLHVCVRLRLRACVRLFCH